MLGDAEPVVDRGIAAGRIKPRRAANEIGRHAGDFLDLFRAVARLGDESGPVLELRPVAALAHESLVDEPFGDDHMRQRRQDGDVGAGLQGEVIIGLDMRRAHEVDAARIDDDELRALAQALLHARGEHRMAVGRVGADDEHDVGVLDGIEILRAGRSAEGGLEAVAGRRMADARASIDIVVAEAAADQLLDEIGLFIGAARGGDAADGARAMRRLNALELGGRVADRLLPGHFAPGLADLGADHRLQNAVAVGGVAPGEAALDAGMAVIGLAVLVGNHADHFFAAHLRLEGAADAAIGACRHRRMFGQADLDDGLFGQRRGRAGLHAGAAGDAFGLQERLVLPGGDPALEAAPVDRQREGALHFLAGPDAAVADDAFGGIIGEIGVRLVFDFVEMVGAFIAIAHFAQANGARPASAIRNRHWRRRSGNPADGRRCKAPSRPCAAPSGAASAS